jgi:hypothetical protein
MTALNAYASSAAVKDAIGITDTNEDPNIEVARGAASRQIDGFCGRGRKFWQDSSVVARYYFGCGNVLYVDDISTATGLIVKVDQGDDGTFETTLTIDTDFKLHPLNAAAEYPVRPWTRIVLLNNTLSSFVPLSSGRANVEVTAKFGWSAIPDAVERATVLQARSIFKAPDTTFGVFAAGLDGQARNIPALDPVARALLEDFVRWQQVDDGA